MVDAEKDAVARTMPFGVASPFWKPQDFHGMFIWILEVKRLNSPSIFVPVRQALWSRRSELNFVLPQDPIGAVHIADNNGDVLKPEIIAARIHRNRPASRSEKLRQLNRLITEFHFNQSHSRSKHAEEVFHFITRDFAVRDLLKCQDARVEIH